MKRKKSGLLLISVIVMEVDELGATFYVALVNPPWKAASEKFRGSLALLLPRGLDDLTHSVTFL